MSRTEVRLYPIQGIYKLMRTGKLAVPAFQRRFAWSKSQVRELLDSIYRGYPIGTVLVIEDHADRYRVLDPHESLFPAPDRDRFSLDARVWYVLDGSQRLAALYNTFFGDNRDFEFWFDLKAEEFVLNRKQPKSGHYVNLRSLYSNEFPDAFVQLAMEEEKLAEDEEPGMLFDRVNGLHTAFRDYQLVVQILIDLTLEDAIEVYQRLNRSGSPLSHADIE